MATLDLSEYVRVVNHTGTTIKGRYDGKDYVFKPDEQTDVHMSVAVHVFGFGVEDKTPAFHRLGWVSTGSLEEAQAKLENIEFTDVPSPAVNITSGRKKTVRAKTSSPTPLADAGADVGEGDTSPSEALDLSRVAGDF